MADVAPSRSPTPVLPRGLPCGLGVRGVNRLDSGDPCWRKKIESTTIDPIARNSLCQFWNDSNQNQLQTAACLAGLLLCGQGKAAQSIASRDEVPDFGPETPPG